MVKIETDFDFRSDTPVGKDPDSFSPTLRQYHQILWGRELPNGKDFSLSISATRAKAYLEHDSDLGHFVLSSDSVIPTFSKWNRMLAIIEQFSVEEIENFRSVGYTIGGMIVWPTRSATGFRSINVVRGFNSLISDRMDLTLECVKRHYQGGSSPLGPVLATNAEFFGLFEDFDGFVEHFLLQDLLATGSTSVDFFLPFSDFSGPARPSDASSYQDYMGKSLEFVAARNRRIGRIASELEVRGG